MASKTSRSHQLTFLLPIAREKKGSSSIERVSRKSLGQSEDNNWRELLLDRLEKSGLTKIDKPRKP